ncbi:septal ring lytic transglycosylase RlpA family protein [Patescibacteria group bacterium]|nr:septal ring lytic transglycosylase RlpA family protein [Patescibacteria group bacterium]
MASGKRYDQDKTLIAHRHYPMGLMVRITNLQNGLSVIARVEDRGPYHETDIREVDLSLGAARVLRSVRQGVVPVKIEPLNAHLEKWVQGFEQLV